MTEISDLALVEEDWQEYLEFHVGDIPELYAEVWQFYRQKIDDVRAVIVKEYKQSMPEMLRTCPELYKVCEDYTLAKAKELTKQEYNLR